MVQLGSSGGLLASKSRRIWSGGLAAKFSVVPNPPQLIQTWGVLTVMGLEEKPWRILKHEAEIRHHKHHGP